MTDWQQCLTFALFFVMGALAQHYRLKAKRFRELYIDAAAVLLQARIDNSRMHWELTYANRKIAILEGKDGEGWKA